MTSFSSVSGGSLLRRLLVFGTLWVILTDADVTSWGVGIPVVLFATWLSERTGSRIRINYLAFFKFLPVFLFRSIVAAFDVARRTLAPRLLVSPGVVTYEVGLPAGLSRVVFMNTLSLLPGTLSLVLEENYLTVHVLDAGRDHPAELARLEQTMARIFPEVAE